MGHTQATHDFILIRQNYFEINILFQVLFGPPPPISYVEIMCGKRSVNMTRWKRSVGITCGNETLTWRMGNKTLIWRAKTETRTWRTRLTWWCDDDDDDVVVMIMGQVDLAMIMRVMIMITTARVSRYPWSLPCLAVHVLWDCDITSCLFQSFDSMIIACYWHDVMR